MKIKNNQIGGSITFSSEIVRGNLLHHIVRGNLLHHIVRGNLLHHIDMHIAT